MTTTNRLRIDARFQTLVASGFSRNDILVRLIAENRAGLDPVADEDVLAFVRDRMPPAPTVPRRDVNQEAHEPQSQQEPSASVQEPSTSISESNRDATTAGVNPYDAGEAATAQPEPQMAFEEASAVADRPTASETMAAD